MQTSSQLQEKEIFSLREKNDLLCRYNENYKKDLRNYTEQVDAVFKQNKSLRNKIK